MAKPLITVLVAALCGVCATTAEAPASARKTIKVGDDYFVHRGSIPTVTVHRGTKVVWRFRGSDLHNIRVTKGPVRFHSSYKSSGRFTKRVRKVGTYRIVCTIHQPDMRMKLRVVR